MKSRAMSSEPTAGATGATADRQRAASAAADRRSVSVVERTSRRPESAVRAQPLLA